MNNVTLIGRLTRDPEVRQLTGGAKPTSVARFTLAVDRRFKRDGENNADFINCQAWGPTAEFLEKYVHQGTKIGLVGRIQTGSYTKQDGTKVYTTEVVAENIEFAESKAASGGGAKAQQPQQPVQPQMQQQTMQQPVYGLPQQPVQPQMQQPVQPAYGQQPMPFPETAGDEWADFTTGGFEGMMN